jgi:hypothetical protein
MSSLSASSSSAMHQISSWNHRYHQLSTRLERLQHDFNEMTVRNAETVYFLQLELDTTRRSKEAVEDRMAELYRDMQDLQDYNNTIHQNKSNPNHHRSRPESTTVAPDVDDSVAVMMKSHQTQIEKYERMLRIMNNQISLLKASSESMVKSLKDEITDLMDDKTKSEIALWNRIHDLERENQDLYHQIQTTAADAAQAITSSATGDSHTMMMMQHSSNHNDKVAPPKPPQRHKSIETTAAEDETPDVDDEKHAAATVLFVMRQELRRLRNENKKLKQQQPLNEWKEDLAATTPDNREPEMREQQRIQQLTQSLENLKTELDIQRETASKNLDAWTEEKAELVRHIADLETKTQQLQLPTEQLPPSSNESVSASSLLLLPVSTEQKQLQEQQQHSTLPPGTSSSTNPNTNNEQETVAIGSELERVALFYERADESIQALETIIMELRINHSDEAAKLVSTLEMASAVHSQIKLSLMLIELKFRNNMGSIVASLATKTTNSEVSAKSVSAPNGKSSVPDILHQIERMKQETAESIADVEALLTLQMEELQTKSMEESTHLRELHDSKVADLKQMQVRHAHLEAEIERYLSTQATDLKGSAVVVVPTATTTTAAMSGSDVVVSQQALQTLQTEVLQVVHRIKEKNEIIARLTAEIQEHKIRERTLMEELKRHMREQADRQLAEQHRIMQQNARRIQVSRQEETDEDDEISEEELSEYEEQTVDDEEIIYEA